MNKKHVFIIHGLFDCTTSWKPVAEILEKDFQVHLLPLRNHKNAKFTDTMSFAEMAEDIKFYADEHKIEKFSLVGHSLGGKTAMHFAKIYPQQLEKLVVIDITPFPQKSLQEYNPLTTTLLNQVVTLKNMDLSKYSNLSEFVTDVKKIDRETQSAIVGNINYSGKNFSWYINIDSVFNNFDNLLDGFYVEDFVEKKISIPSLFIKAENSEFFPKRDFKAAKYIFTDMQIVEIKGVTHKIHLEKGRDLGIEISKFLHN